MHCFLYTLMASLLIFMAASQTTGAEADPAYRTIAPENLLLIETRSGRISIELNPDFAPKHVQQIRSLVSQKAYEGATFYRVIDGFVAQGGLEDDILIDIYDRLDNENDRPISEAGFVPLGNADLFAPEVGHIDGFAVGRSAELGTEWLLHCPGAMAMARDEDPDSGRTEFYIVLAAQRYLDRNLTVFGRVIEGMQHVQSLKRGDRAIESGVIQPPDRGDRIVSMHLASELPTAERPSFQVMQMPSAAFEAAKRAKRVRTEPFFYRPPPQLLDICNFEVPVRPVQAPQN